MKVKKKRLLKKINFNELARTKAKKLKPKRL